MGPGNTPMVKAGEVYAKLECVNPTGSIKDRIAKYIFDKSEEKGFLKPGMTIVEASSGNTGIAMSYFAKQKGYPITIVMPENMSDERKQLIEGLGANLILCSEGDFAEAAAIRNKIADNPEFFNPDQFSNPLNVECHKVTTGSEIIEQIKPYSDIIDAFVAGVGTGGTLIGVAKALKEINPDVHIAAVEPAESPVMSGGKSGIHEIQGIGDGFIPAIAGDGGDGLHEIIDEVICISSEDAKNAAMNIQKEFGFCVGISSGANYLAAIQLREKYKTVVTVFADGFVKYMSNGLSRLEENKCIYEDKNSLYYKMIENK
ncbi:PLP-dependent cysteine synthase family protein [candidate division KSB1 bacterium]